MGLTMRTYYLLALTLLLTCSIVGRLGLVYGAGPSATTLSPIDVTATSATLRGIVNPNGKSTIVDFASALPSGDPGYFPPAPSPPQNIGSGVVPVLVTYTLTGLSPSTEFQYAVRSTNADGSQNGAVVIFNTLAAAVTTDWAVLSVSLSPSAPYVGDPVTFNMVMTALSSSGSFPQSFSAFCVIDGASCGGGSLTYSGPMGTPYTVSTQTPWIATLGTHTLTWGVATIPVGLDPNKSNNAMSQSFTVASQAQFDFSMSASPTQQSVVPGGSTSYAVTVNLVSGAAQSVALSLSTPPPAGVSVSFAPMSGTPPFSSTLSVTTTSSASPGTITLTISGIGGGASHSAPVTLIVSQAPDFQIEVSPASQSALQGQTVSYTVNVAALNGFNSQVSLTVTGAPSGANTVFSVPSATPNFVSTLTVTLPASAPAGSFTLAITGSGGGVSHLANAVLIINQATQTQTSSSSTETSTTSSASDLMTMLQQNYLLAIGALILILVVAALVLRGRRKPATGATTQATPTTYCPKCGTQNPTINQFCGKCGAKLR